MRQIHTERNALGRPALATLIGAMEKLSRPQRVEVARLGRRARAAKVPWIRRLTWRAVAEARRLEAARQELVRSDQLEDGPRIGIDGKARQEVGDNHLSPEREGRDGKSYPATQPAPKRGKEATRELAEEARQ